MKSPGIKTKAAFLLSVIGFFAACNKDSLQLPDKQNQQFITQNVVFNGVNKIEAVFSQDADDTEGKTEVRFKNVSGDTLFNVNILLEYCSDTKHEVYGKCASQTVVNIDTLFSQRSFTYKVPFFMNNFETAYINTVLVSAKDHQQIISNRYATGYVNFEKQDNKLINSGQANGYVSADGSFLIRINRNSKPYHIKGSLLDTTLLLNAKLNDSLSLSLDTIQTPAKHFEFVNQKLKFRLKLNSALDSTKTLLIYLQK